MPQSDVNDGSAEPICEATSNINEGPNYLRAWMRYRHVKSVSLARSLNVSEAAISLLINGRHGLSARWLRRLAPLLDVTPGMLLDYDPAHLDDDMIKMLLAAYSESSAGAPLSSDGVEGDDETGSPPDMDTQPLPGFVPKQ